MKDSMFTHWPCVQFTDPSVWRVVNAWHVCATAIFTSVKKNISTCIWYSDGDCDVTSIRYVTLALHVCECHLREWAKQRWKELDKPDRVAPTKRTIAIFCSHNRDTSRIWVEFTSFAPLVAQCVRRTDEVRTNQGICSNNDSRHYNALTKMWSCCFFLLTTLSMPNVCKQMKNGLLIV